MAHSKLYIRIMNSREWDRVKKIKKQLNPYCEECLKQGIIQPTQCIHHIVEIESQRTEADAWSVGLALGNLESLCFACHRAIHAGHNSKAAHKRRNEDRLAAWIAEQTGQQKSEDI